VSWCCRELQTGTFEQWIAEEIDVKKTTNRTKQTKARYAHAARSYRRMANYTMDETAIRYALEQAFEAGANWRAGANSHDQR
jgi:hypothetical protein